MTIRVGDLVRCTEADGPALYQAHGGALVLAVDEDAPVGAQCTNRPVAWIRHTSQEGSNIYRSVDQGALKVIATVATITASLRAYAFKVAQDRAGGSG